MGNRCQFAGHTVIIAEWLLCTSVTSMLLCHFQHMFKASKLDQRMKPIIFFLLIASSVPFGCKKNTRANAIDSPTIEGVWYFIENDSLYGEIIFTKDHFWTYDEGGGEIFVGYKFKNDSVEFENGITSKFALINKDEFTLHRDGMKVHFYRLNVPIDVNGLLQGDEKVFDDYVIKGIRERKYKWESSRK
jgi:hypothetical protein